VEALIILLVFALAVGALVVALRAANLAGQNEERWGNLTSRIYDLEQKVLQLTT
jgi:hypothetical protein